MKPPLEIKSLLDVPPGDGSATSTATDQLSESLLRKAIQIREVEEAFLALFSKGKLNGTVHTCVGQEFSALAFAGQLEPGDCIFSNHRCHGHFIAF
ncbi:MAG: 2-oxoisovalerate dehydrogenase E1 component, partial [Verrucomicrobiales bacterium]